MISTNDHILVKTHVKEPASHMRITTFNTIPRIYKDCQVLVLWFGWHGNRNTPSVTVKVVSSKTVWIALSAKFPGMISAEILVTVSTYQHWKMITV